MAKECSSGRMESGTKASMSTTRGRVQESFTIHLKTTKGGRDTLCKENSTGRDILFVKSRSKIHSMIHSMIKTHSNNQSKTKLFSKIRWLMLVFGRMGSLKGSLLLKKWIILTKMILDL